ncbi:PepSY-associated TM helix domain-containing protein [Cyclobacterium jeungdonense]|uniref:PepSY-associated TM helix domain-containing protein n=1 Tax=Cyclobacterium jeungdonense TaxID=708087 RepID=A0ABT8C5B9_9BACT|nr:PepSY-associated TM helix domain-containing protein [Cyclobacterium jeungdonense]MDN3686988.1 PepSY-associated TM helix domain-containing protein [Cyclobacterium jeungdonense]
MTIRKFLAKTHLVIGLSTGVLFTIIALSGALYTWEPEFSRLMYHQQVAEEGKPFISISEIRNTLEKTFPEGDFRTALYRDPESSIEVLLYAPGTYYLAQLNPYTAELIHLQDMNKGWINYVKKLHRNLLLGEAGREIVHWITLLALPMLISGLVIWWPANGWPRKNKFYLRWSLSPKKLNYNLHSILGFYASWILFFAVITGIYWGFGAVRTTVKQLSGETKINWETPLSSDPGTGQGAGNDAMLNRLISEYHAEFRGSEVRISIPHKKEDPIHLSIIDPNKGITEINHYYHDQYTGDRIQGNFLNGLSSEISTFNVINGMVYDIHFGSILGLPGRVLVFLGSLIAGSLPITGFIIWWAKRKKRPKK